MYILNISINRIIRNFCVSLFDIKSENKRQQTFLIHVCDYKFNTLKYKNDCVLKLKFLCCKSLTKCCEASLRLVSV